MDDLNIPGKYKGDSIFNLFDHTRSRGGGQLLESMFQHPLSDAEAINIRSSIFQYFQERAIEFPVSRDQCEEVEQYLSSAGSNNMAGTTLMIMRKKMLRTIASGKEYDAIHEQPGEDVVGPLPAAGTLDDIRRI